MKISEYKIREGWWLVIYWKPRQLREWGPQIKNLPLFYLFIYLFKDNKI